jgi:hypothetical protein
MMNVVVVMVMVMVVVVVVGYGIDLRKRKIWDKFEPAVRLVESTVEPQ